ncbi:MAG: ammonia-forming cytochrome c nitrite reductase subunit c552 [Anaerolineaceae bacterium]|nr:ammonia-forming cytochrome c nitrite reductase subunit c552 [Anaerolineaceae bacterium]
MKKISIPPLVITLIIVVLSGLVVGLLLYINNQPAPTRGVSPLVIIDAMEPDSEKWGINFPNQYSALLKTKSNDIRTSFGGSQKVDKLAVDPMLVDLFAGYAFSKAYDEDRGHLWALEDVRETLRLNDTTPATCYSCKSSNNPSLWAEMGMAAYDAMKFSEMTPKITQPIGCANCHEANTMRLIVTNPALEEALLAQGKDWKTFTRQEMRSVVCANCHVEYYFKGDGKYLTLPWAGGTTIEEIEKYYDDVAFTDWTHPDSGAAMIKMQHPDFELFSAGSTHYNAGVSCADCHMPYTRDGAAKFSNHDVKSPLIDPSASCGTCHTDVEYVVGRVGVIQQQVNTTMLNTERAIVDAIKAIKLAGEQPGADSALLEEARRLHRSAQLRWDFLAAENSMGFHNPEEALRILATATDYARQAQTKAVQAMAPVSTASK